MNRLVYILYKGNYLQIKSAYPNQNYSQSYPWELIDMQTINFTAEANIKLPISDFIILERFIILFAGDNSIFTFNILIGEVILATKNILKLSYSHNAELS